MRYRYGRAQGGDDLTRALHRVLQEAARPDHPAAPGRRLSPLFTAPDPTAA